MAISVTKKGFYEIPLPIGLAGLNSLGYARTDFYDNTNFGFNDLYIQIKFKSGTGDVGSTPYITLYFIETNDIIGSLKTYRRLGSFAFDPDVSYTTGFWIDNVPTFWGLGVVNNSDSDLASDPTEFVVTAVGLFDQVVDQYFFSYNAAGGPVVFFGDATETSFPYVYEASGSIAFSNMLPVPLITALGILTFGGMATVVTPFIQVATGRLHKSGIASGPSAAP